MKKKDFFGSLFALLVLGSYLMIPEDTGRTILEPEEENQDQIVEEVYVPDEEGSEEIPSSLPVKITVYHPVEGQCDSTPLETADLSKIDLQKLQKGQLRWIAVSRDLLKEFSYGDSVYLESSNPDISGYYEIHDTMNKRFTRYVDLLVYPGTLYGKWEGKIRRA